MTARRYSITKEEGELVRLALKTLIPELEELAYKTPLHQVFYQGTLHRAEILLENLTNYKWEK